jgi:hypothetical protein
MQGCKARKIKGIQILLTQIPPNQQVLERKNKVGNQQMTSKCRSQ